jgi:hypothetical protein
MKTLFVLAGLIIAPSFVTNLAFGQTPTSIRIVGIEARFVSMSDGTLGPNSIDNGGKPFTDSVLFNVIVSDKRSTPMEIFDLVFSVATKSNGKILLNDRISQFNTIMNKTAYFPFLSRIGSCDDFQLTAKLINSKTKQVHQIFKKQMPFDCGD